MWTLRVGSKAIKEKAYLALVHPTLEYASLVWDLHTAKNIVARQKLDSGGPHPAATISVSLPVPPPFCDSGKSSPVHSLTSFHRFLCLFILLQLRHERTPSLTQLSIADTAFCMMITSNHDQVQLDLQHLELFEAEMGHGLPLANVHHPPNNPEEEILWL